MADLVVSIDDRELRRAARAYSRLGESVPRAIRDSLSEVAVDAQKRLRDRWDRDIEGGPARFTEIQPGGKRGAVLDRRARQAVDGLTSSIGVNRLQERYLRYALGEARSREPGEVGAADEKNFIPIARSAIGIGSLIDRHGNLPRNTLKLLNRAKTSQREKDRAAVDRKARKAGRAGATGKEVSAFRSARKARSKGQIRRVDERVNRVGEIYFGRSRKGVLGFWQRPADRRGRPELLVLAVDRSQYRGDALVDGWNRSVTDAMENLPKRLQRRLRERIAQG